MAGTADRARPARLFAYGTLMEAAVLRAVLGRLPPRRPAVLAGFRRCRLHGAPWPGLVREEGALTRGLLLERLRPGDWRRLDRYEGPDYVRCTVRVRDDRGRMLAAQVYLPAPGVKCRR